MQRLPAFRSAGSKRDACCRIQIQAGVIPLAQLEHDVLRQIFSHQRLGRSRALPIPRARFRPCAPDRTGRNRQRPARSDPRIIPRARSTPRTPSASPVMAIHSPPRSSVSNGKLSRDRRAAPHRRSAAPRRPRPASVLKSAAPRNQLRLDAEFFRQNHPRQHHRRARPRIRRHRLDLAQRNLRNQQDTAHRTMAGNPGSAKIFELLPRHFDHRHNADIGFAGGQLVGALRRQREAQIENLALRRRAAFPKPAGRYSDS